MKNLFEGMENFIGMVESISENVKDGVVEKSGRKVTVEKKNGKTFITIDDCSDRDSKMIEEKKEEFDNSGTLNLIKEFKDYMEDLDDCTFCELCDTLVEKHGISTNRMNYLMEIEDHSPEEAGEVVGMIEKATKVLVEILEGKIGVWSDLLDKITGDEF